ncbi:MAG: transglutaminase family protein [Pseudomonadales bacterium]|nr:transglutaminase family protein [Pseudomonadales bacterium]MCP5184187.1 transglutaminase family protein [Pseudomonadales bacterium]
MSIRVALSHRTAYRYDRRVQLFPHVIRLRPAPHCRTPVSAYSLKVLPEPHFVNWQQDPFGNYLARFVFPEPARELSIDVSLIADLTVINPFDFFLDEAVETFPFAYEPQLRRDLTPYLEVSEDSPRLTTWLKSVAAGPVSTVTFLVELNQRLQHDVRYLVRMEPGVQTCEQTLALGSGSCRDSAWLLVQILRRLGLAARFVSGYLVQLKADQAALDGPSGTDHDFTDLHAWTEVYLPGAGWIGLDPTSGLFAGEGHIPLACTPEPASAAAVTGATSPAEVTFSFANEVTRIHEDPRVTKPFSSTAWRRVLRLGAQVDAELARGDVRLTMGGEPTFVSIDDMDGAAWNFTALSPAKTALARQLLDRLQAHYAPSGLLHFGQGKWYPGEPLPRWVMSLFWRTDGKPIVRHPQCLTVSGAQGGTHSVDDARRLVEAVARRLKVGVATICPGYEDVFHHLVREQALPENVSPLDSRLDDPLERERLARIFSAGLTTPAGFALPLGWRSRGRSGGWVSSRWRFRAGAMFLLPGDSPMGLRLPLASLPWVEPDAREAEPEVDPFAAREALPEAGAEAAEKLPESTQEVVHTALVVEAREGTLHVFLPPVERLEAYLALVDAIAACAARQKLAVVLEGYEPPKDPRLKVLQITPDPGVIEVNVPPVKSFDELVANTERLYDEARSTRLGTEKFMLDGRHSGTGGGNHVTLGGASPEDSPFLRRPELLGGLLRFWQRHPSMSYLFSGQFIGPTSQAPRVDEARDDNLYELEIALDRLPEGETDKPWLVDRVLRNFLVDLTGNTHRSEFCIDKLYSPDSAGGRRGLVELRAFEMPPHPHMSVAQMLLIRALVARFWKQPYRAPLIRWGTDLHDRFMLRHFVWQDFQDVLRGLNRAGYRFEEAWYLPFLEFRFPFIGRLEARGISVELHAALEPWHVLGEESSGQGTARYVDSSVERLQVLVRGLPGDRYAVACNGRHVPLHPTGEQGTYVAGVRYKAWNPPSSLHPTIDVHGPLVFDLVDQGNARSIAGGTYHVSHPGGRNYDTFPLNANEAEARRGARFIAHGGTQGRLRLEPRQPHPDLPFTLDLRRGGG